jgi:hypothetical protein
MPKPKKLPLKKQKALQRLQDLFQQPGSRDLLWYHHIGQQVNQLCPADERGYGQNRMGSLATDVGKPASYADTLWKARSFFKKYDRSEVRSLCKPGTTNSFVLTWSHMLHLFSLDDDDRPGFQKDCLSDEWSCKELHRRIKEHREPQGQGGRRFRKPESVEDALRQLIFECKTWDRRFHEVWFSMDEPAIRLEAGKYKSQEVANLAAEAIEMLETLQSDIKEGLPRLKALKVAWKKTKRRRQSR